MPQYFHGVSVHGPVKAFPSEKFSDVIDAFRIAPTIPMARAAFLALPKAERNEKKQVPFFTAACFRQSPSRRVTEEATHCNLVILDLDENKDGTCPAAPFVHNPQLLHDALQGFSFIAHTTASSTAEKPRMRVIVDAEEIPLNLYPKAVATIARLLGITKITTESRVAVQPMFQCVRFLDTNDEDDPLLAHQLAERFKVLDLTDDADTEWEHHGKNGSNGTHAQGDDLFFLRAPLPEVSLAVAKEALSHIDADLGYMEWIEVGAALRHQFSPHQSDEAYELFDEWSATAETKYQSSEDTLAKWRSLRPTPVGRMPITIRSLLAKAVAGGWDDKRIKETSYNKLVDWMETVATSTELLEKGVSKILAAPLLSNIQEDVLVDKMRVALKRRFGDTIPAAAIKKDLLRLRKAVKEQEKKTEQPKEPKWAKGVLYVSNTRELFRRHTGEKYTETAFNACYSRFLLPSEADLREQQLPITPALLCKPTVEPFNYALDYLKIPTVTDFAYDPGKPTEMFFINRGVKYVNTYSPTYPAMDPENSEKAEQLLLNHLENLIAEPQYRTTLLDFLSFIVQFPGHKIRWAVLLQSAEGAGKTFFAKLLQAVLGFEHVKILSDGAIKSGFTEWAFGHQVIAIEEIYASGVNRHAIMDTIKPLITNDDISVDEKFRNNRQVLNISNYILFSNRHDALALTQNDRRYFIVKSPLQTKQQILALGDDYFEKLFGGLRQYAGAMRHFLMHRSISPTFRPNGHAPRTHYVNEMVQDSSSELASTMRRLMLEGDYPLIQYDIVSAKMMVDVLRQVENLPFASPQQVAAVLRDEGFEQHGRHQFGEDRHYLWARRGVSGVSATAEQRVKQNLKNLCMELLFSS